MVLSERRPPWQSQGVQRGEEGEEREVTEKREEEREVGRGLVREERVDWVDAAGAGDRNWGKTKEGGMCSWGSPARISKIFGIFIWGRLKYLQYMARVVPRRQA